MFSRGVSFWLGFTTGIMVAIVLIAHSPRCNAEEPTAEKQPKVVTYRVAETCDSKSVRAALVPMLEEARRLQVEDEWEYGGMVTRDPAGNYCASVPLSSEHPTRIAYMYQLPAGHALVAFYHSHPVVDFVTYLFSRTDVASACLVNRTSYIVTGDGFILRFDPSELVCLEDPVNMNPGRMIGRVQP
jgi:proteasome lid subunit RPN8/RPN11